MFKIWKLADTLFVLRSTFCVRLVMWLRAATVLSFSSKTHRSIRVHATVLMRFRFIKSSIHIFLRFYSSTILKSQKWRTSWFYVSWHHFIDSDEENLLKNIYYSYINVRRKKTQAYAFYLYLEITHWTAKMGEMSIFVSLKNEAFRQNVLLVA